METVMETVMETAKTAKAAKTATAGRLAETLRRMPPDAAVAVLGPDDDMRDLLDDALGGGSAGLVVLACDARGAFAAGLDIVEIMHVSRPGAEADAEGADAGKGGSL